LVFVGRTRACRAHDSNSIHNRPKYSQSTCNGIDSIEFVNLAGFEGVAAGCWISEIPSFGRLESVRIPLCVSCRS
jgi:hypothetical protein